MSTLTRRDDLEALLLDEMRRSFAESERTTAEIHVSDLLSPRKAYWSRVLPRPVTNDEIGYFVAGRGHEDAMARVSGVTPGETRVVDGITLRCDFYTSIPLEFKTRRRKMAKDSDDAADRYGEYVRQTKSYCALLNRPAAWIWVLGLVDKQDDGSTKPSFQVWQVEFTPEELAEERTRLMTERDALETAWQTVLLHLKLGKNDLGLLQEAVKGLTLCPPWQCGSASVLYDPWVCEECGQSGVGPHCVTCHRFFQGEWGAERHVGSKTGAGHETVAGKTHTEYRPRCRWWDVCQPQLVDPDRGPRDPDAVAESSWEF